MPWILLCGFTVIAVSAYFFYRHIKNDGKTLQEILSTPLLRGKTVEVNFFGGLLSFRIGGSKDIPALDNDSAGHSRRLEDPATVRIRELTEIARLLENDLITLDEYNKTKQQIFKSYLS